MKSKSDWVQTKEIILVLIVKVVTVRSVLSKLLMLALNVSGLSETCHLTLLWLQRCSGHPSERASPQLGNAKLSIDRCCSAVIVFSHFGLTNGETKTCCVASSLICHLIVGAVESWCCLYSFDFELLFMFDLCILLDKRDMRLYFDSVGCCFPRSRHRSALHCAVWWQWNLVTACGFSCPAHQCMLSPAHGLAHIHNVIIQR